LAKPKRGWGIYATTTDSRTLKHSYWDFGPTGDTSEDDDAITVMDEDPSAPAPAAATVVTFASSVDAFSSNPAVEFKKLTDMVSAMHVFFGAVHHQQADNLVKERLRSIIGKDQKKEAQAKKHFRQGVLKLGTLTSRRDVVAIPGKNTVQKPLSLSPSPSPPSEEPLFISPPSLTFIPDSYIHVVFVFFFYGKNPHFCQVLCITSIITKVFIIFSPSTC
jgi:hypothetical protein